MIVAITASVLCLACMYYGISLLMEQRDRQVNFAVMKEVAGSTGDESDHHIPETGVYVGKEVTTNGKINFTALRERYPDIYAWITVPGTNVDYAIVQHPTDDSFYLQHGYEQEEAACGAVYSELCNKKDFSDPMTVLYGHNMKDGSMFGSLHRFEERSFFDEHREFTIYTEDYEYTYRIFGAYVFENRHILKAYDFTDEKQFEKYLKTIYSIRGMQDFILKEPAVTTKDHIVTLSTCKGLDHSIRYLVQGVLTDKVKVEAQLPQRQ